MGVAVRSFGACMGAQGPLSARRVRHFVSSVDGRTHHVAFHLGATCRAPSRIHKLLSGLFKCRIPRSLHIFPPLCTSFNGGVAMNRGIFVGTYYRFRSRNKIAVNSKYRVKRGMIFTALGRKLSPRGQGAACPTPVILNGGI